MSCTEGDAAAQLVPSPQRPITTEILGSVSLRRTPAERMLSVSGLAGAGVTSVGLVAADGHSVKTPVAGGIYALKWIPARHWIAIAAYDSSGNEVYREPLVHRPGPPQSNAPPTAKALPTAPPLAPPGKPVQHAEVEGAAIDVYSSGHVVVEFTSHSPLYAFLRDHSGGHDKVTVECGQVAFGAGRWATLGSGVYASFGSKIEATIPSLGSGVRPPFDVCSVRGWYGRRWDEHVGYHNAVEFAFNETAKRFFAEQAAARRIAYFVRSPKLKEIRAQLKAGGTAPSTAEIASRFDASVVALATRDELPPVGKVGVWSDGAQTIVAAQRADDGRRMYVTLEHGRIGQHNLNELAFGF